MMSKDIKVVKHLFEEKGPGCEIPKEYQNGLSFTEMLEALDSEDKVAIIFDFYTQATKIKSRIRPNVFLEEWRLHNFNDLKFLSIKNDDIQFLKFDFLGSTNLITTYQGDIQLTRSYILNNKKEWIVGESKKLLSFCVRYWRIQESYREISKSREERWN